MRDCGRGCAQVLNEHKKNKDSENSLSSPIQVQKSYYL